MKINGELDAICAIVITKRLKVRKHVQSINHNGTNMSRIIVIKVIMALKGGYKDQKKDFYGNQLFKSMHNHMMNLLLKQKQKIISVPLTSIVWKQYVHHVAQLLLGQNLQNQNHQPKFCN